MGKVHRILMFSFLFHLFFLQLFIYSHKPEPLTFLFFFLCHFRTHALFSFSSRYTPIDLPASIGA